MRFEVFIPAEGADGFDVTLKLEAPNWMSALKGGLGKLGASATDIRNVVCDIQEDGSILVTDPVSHGVFRIRELEGSPVAPSPLEEGKTKPDLAVQAAAAQAAAEEAQRAREEAERRALEWADGKTKPDLSAQAAAAQAEALARRAREEAERRAREEALRRAKEAAELALREEAVRQANQDARRTAAEAAARQAEVDAAQRAEAARRAAEEKRKAAAARHQLEAQQRKASDAHRSAERKQRPPEPEAKILSESASRADSKAAAALRRTAPSDEEAADEVLAAVFEQMMDLQLAAPDVDGAARFALDLAVRHIDAESGAVLLADLDRADLRFAAAHGPKAAEVARFRIQMGQGIAGFSAREGITLSVSEAARDPRFYKQIAEQVGYMTRSVLCAPMLHEGRSFGCIELINRRGRPTFGAADAAALGYIATQLAEYLAPRVGREAWFPGTG